jgi:flagellar P-ring protein precursor FlgI
MKSLRATILCSLLLIPCFNGHGVTVRVGDRAFPLGSRDNQLIGIGVVYGLNSDGDKNLAFTLQALANTLRHVGKINVPASAISSKNAAAVMVTANIPHSLKSGNKIDVLVASMGDAKSLQGGVLAITPLVGPDGKTYASAQGALTVGGFSLGTTGANVQKNHPTTAQCTAIVEESIPVTLVRGDFIEFVLYEPDYTSAARMAEAINAKYPSSSHMMDASTVRIKIPDTYRTAAGDFVAQVQAIEFIPAVRAVVVINERTSTVVATAGVKISSCAVSQGGITVKISETQDVSQPNPFAQTGQTVTTTTANTQVTEAPGRMKALQEMPTVERVAATLNELGATPRDMMAIFQAMKQAGALQAELIIR